MTNIQPWGTSEEMYSTAAWYDEPGSGMGPKDLAEALMECDGLWLEWCELNGCLFIRVAPVQ